MNEAEAFGMPSATQADEQRPRCPLDGGYYDENGECEFCARGVVWVEQRAALNHQGRYEVFVVLGDGVPRTEITADFLADALELSDAVRAGYRARNHNQLFVGVTDSNDPERGHLADHSYDERFDVGPDPSDDERCLHDDGRYWWNAETSRRECVLCGRTSMEAGEDTKP